MRIKAQAAKNVHQVADAHCSTAALENGMDHGVNADNAVRN